VGGTFGFNRLIEKIGIERRVYTSGERKVMLDPFLPEKPEDVERIKAIQREIHQGFIALVKSRRGAALTGPEETLFSGEYWTGQKSLELGIADRIGDLRSTLRERFGEKLVTPLVSADRSFFGRRIPGVGGTYLGQLWGGTGFADEMLSSIEARALWARYGL
jgi:serine protease SohB